MGLHVVLSFVSLFAAHGGSRLTCPRQAKGRLGLWNRVIESCFTFAELVFISEQRRAVKKLLVKKKLAPLG